MKDEQLVYQECAIEGCGCVVAYQSDLCPGHHAAREAVQQLAQAREEIAYKQHLIEEYQRMYGEEREGHKENALAVYALKDENAQARALLERHVYAYEHPATGPEQTSDVVQATKAFLADKEPAPDKADG